MDKSDKTSDKKVRKTWFVTDEFGGGSGYLLLLFNARGMKAKRALRDTLFTILLPLFKTKGKGSKPFGLAEVQLRVAEFFALGGRGKDGGMESDTGREGGRNSKYKTLNVKVNINSQENKHDLLLKHP